VSKSFETDSWHGDDGHYYVRTEAIYFERTGEEAHRRAGRVRMQRDLLAKFGIASSWPPAHMAEWDRALDYATDDLVAIVWRTTEPVGGGVATAA
jgi:hypothetical protein